MRLAHDNCAPTTNIHLFDSTGLPRWRFGFWIITPSIWPCSQAPSKCVLIAVSPGQHLPHGALLSYVMPSRWIRRVYPRVRLPAVPPSTPNPTTARTPSQRSRVRAGIRICSEDFGNAAAFAMAAGALHSAPALGAMHDTPCTPTCLEDEARCLEPQKAEPSTANSISRRVEDYAKIFWLRFEAQRK